MPGTEVRAAGVVCFRKKHVLLVHRPKYDDWSFPKGKLDKGEHVLGAAIRETCEESGLLVRLTVPLADQHYAVDAGTKRVQYWAARVRGAHAVDHFSQPGEIDQVAWVPLAEAPATLTYERDRDTLAEGVRRRTGTRALVILRHADARPRKTWRVDDRMRPLTADGEEQADRLVPLLDAYGITRVLTSSSTRCLQTVQPFVDHLERTREDTGDVDPWVVRTPGLSEEDADRFEIIAEVERVLDSDESAVVCTHRPVLPRVFDALGLDPIPMATGQMIVLHHRHGTLVAVEEHRAS